jgi:hypothetical protein
MYFLHVTYEFVSKFKESQGGCACEVETNDKLFARRFIVYDFGECFQSRKLMAMSTIWMCLALFNPLQALWDLLRWICFVTLRTSCTI